MTGHCNRVKASLTWASLAGSNWRQLSISSRYRACRTLSMRSWQFTWYMSRWMPGAAEPSCRAERTP